MCNKADGYWSIGAGVQYNPTSSYFVAAGIKYFWLGDATAQAGSYSVPGNSLNAQSSEFKDNYAIAYGLKFGYKFLTYNCERKANFEIFLITKKII